MDFAISILKALEKIRNPFLDFLFQSITRLGEEVIVLGIICIFYWCLNKNTAYRLGIVFFSSGIAVQNLKVAFAVPRPFVIDPSLTPCESALPSATGYSFPSGHTQSATALYGFFGLTLKKRAITIACFAAVFLVAFSRLYLGVHTIYDVAVSFLVTIIMVLAVNRFYPRFASGKHDLVLASVLSAVSVLTAVFSYLLAYSGHAEFGQIGDCFKSAGAGLAFGIGFYIERKFVKFDPTEGSPLFQVLKLIFGVAGAMIIKSLPKLIAENNLAVDFIRYFLAVIFVILIYPLIFSAISKKLNFKSGSGKTETEKSLTGNESDQV